MRQEHLGQIVQAVSAVEQMGTVNAVYFVACGGSQAVLMAGQYIFDKETTVPSHVYTANEFMYDTPKSLNEQSLVISCSHSGNTPETVAATKLAREKGAMTIALSNAEGSPLWNAAQCPVHYDWGKEVSDSDKNKGILYGLLFHLLKVLAPSEKWDVCLKELDKLSELSGKAKELYQEKAERWAKENKREKLIYTIGSGINYGEVYSTAMCWFMEMQWIHSGTIHTGEFFHGPFEVTDANTPFVIQVSEGSTRELDERCLKFLHTYAKRIEVLDAKELGLSVIDPAVVDYFNHSLFNNVYPIYNHALAETRQHPLTTRRYMWKVAY